MKLKAGNYYIGDPCYTLGGDGWENVLYASDFFKKPYTKGKKTAVAFDTAYGDGEYYDQENRAYPVDAGMIGAVPVSMATEKTPFGVHVIKFTEDFECEQKGHVIKFGHIEIDTDPQSLEAGIV
jgi:hypothetical protein